MPSSVLLNRSRQVLHVFGESDKYVKMPKGRASLDILSMLDGDLRLGMSTGIQRAIKEKPSFTLHSIPVDEESGSRELIDLTITPGATELIYWSLSKAMSTRKQLSMLNPRQKTSGGVTRGAGSHAASLSHS